MRLVNRLKKTLTRSVSCKIANEIIEKAIDGGWTLTELERKSGIGTSTFTRWRNGEVEPRRQLLAHLQKTVSELLHPRESISVKGPGVEFFLHVDAKAMNEETLQQLRVIRKMIADLEKLCS